MGPDERRIQFTRLYLHAVGRAMLYGANVRAYHHWSLLDNFEWSLGFAPTFGLVAVDRTTFERTPKPSALHLGRVAKGWK